MSLTALRHRRRKPIAEDVDYDSVAPADWDVFSNVYRDAVRQLRADGVVIDENIDHATAVVLVAEAVNWAAKVIAYDYYYLKPEMVDFAAAQPGVESGWGADGCFYLYSPGAGVVSFHDPNREIISDGRWPHPWSRHSRQSLSFACLQDAEWRTCLAWLTSPRISI